MAPPERSGKSLHTSRSGGNNSDNMVQRLVSGGNMYVLLFYFPLPFFQFDFISKIFLFSHRYSGDEGGHEQQQHQQSSENTTENIDHILDNMFVQRPHPYQLAGLGGM